VWGQACILTYTKDFSWEKKTPPNSPDFEGKKIKIPNHAIFIVLFLPSYLVRNQII
jgi:hypothetical protein